MPLQHALSKLNEREVSLLTVDSSTYAEVTEVKNNRIFLKLKTKLKFENLFKTYGMNECLKYGILDISIDRTFPDIPSISENNSQNIQKFNEDEKIVAIPNDEESQTDIEDDINVKISHKFSEEVKTLLFSSNFNDQNQRKRNVIDDHVRVAHVNHDFSDQIINLDKLNYTYTEVVKAKQQKKKFTTPILDSQLNNLTEEINESFIAPTDLFDLRNLKAKDYRNDLHRYLTTELIRSADNFDTTIYETKVVTKKLYDIDLETLISIPHSLEKEVLKTTFRVYKSESNNSLVSGKDTSTNALKPIETLTLNLNIPRLLESQNVLQHMPIVFIKQKVHDANAQNVEVFVKTHEADIKKVYFYNVYVKKVGLQGQCSDFSLVGQINGNSGSLKVKLFSSLCVIRVVACNKLKKELTAFTDKICGTKLKLANHVVNNMTLVLYGTKKGSTSFKVHNVPKDFNKLRLFRRDCTNTQFNVFSPVMQYHIDKLDEKITLNDKIYLPGNYFEYYVEAYSTETGKKTFSNTILCKHHRPHYLDVTLNLEISNKGFHIDPRSSSTPAFSFNVQNNFVHTFKSNITNLVQTQNGSTSIYERNFNPTIAKENPVKDEKAYVVMHEVTRYNLTTKETHTFNPISTYFEDSVTVCISQNIPSIVSNNQYIYTVTSYVKDSSTLAPKLVRNGINSKGESWFHSVFKWKNSEVAKSGRLFADHTDPEFVTEISDYEALTSDYYGITAVIDPKFDTLSDVLNNLRAIFLDSNTVKVVWNSNMKYDTFMVAKIVNGKVKLLGRTNKDFYYAKLEESDVGSVSYAVIPMSVNFNLGLAEITNTLYIDPINKKKVSKKILTGAALT